MAALRRCPGESFRSSLTGSCGSIRGLRSMCRRRILPRSGTMICANAGSIWRSAELSGRSPMTMSMLKSCTTRRRSSSLARIPGGRSVARSRLPSWSHEPWCAPTPGSFAGSLLAEAFKEKGLPVPHVSAVSFSIPLFNALLATGNFSVPVTELAAAVQPAPHIVQGAADRIAGPTRPGRDHHIEEADTEPGSAAFHRARPRGREAVGEAK